MSYQIQNSLNFYFIVFNLLFCIGALGSILGLANSQNLVPEEIMTQSLTIIFLYLIIIVINGIIFKIIEMRLEE